MTQNNDTPELVLTIPTSYDADLTYWMRARITVSVLTLLIAEAKQEVIIATPYIQRDEGLSKEPLSDALSSALQRGVQVHIASTGESLHQLNIDKNLKKYRSQLHFYQPRAHVQDPNRLGSHAKFWLSDDQQAYVGSANLTGPGLTQHLELGILVKGTVAQQIYRVWKHLQEIDFFVKVSV
ncbi:MAG: hypothetical protein IAE89_13685 [Anaerolineae bacterium]|nr:hypothetical protein [Anaerolineae bacterium]